MKDKGLNVTENWNYITISLISFAILTLLVLYMPNIRELDYAMLDGIKHVLAPYPTSVSQKISDFGNGFNILLFWIEFAGVCVLISHQRYLKAFLMVFYTQLANITNLYIKNWICRPRPHGISYAGYSFPSAHATISMCLLGIMIYLIIKHAPNNVVRYIGATILVIYIALICLSRLWLGVHFPIDILAGLFLGFIFLNLYIITVKAFQH